AVLRLQSTWTPTRIARGNLFLNAVLDYALDKWLGTWGIPLATAICNVAGAWALVVVLRRELGSVDFGGLASTTSRVLAASAAVAAVSWVVWHPLDSTLGRPFPAQA